MWAGDFTPSSSGRMKPVTKAQLRKMQNDYTLAAGIAEQALEEERREQERIKREMDDELGQVF